MYQKILIRLILLSSSVFLSGCGHYGSLYYPEDAAYHKHHPPTSKVPTTAVTAKQTDEYQDIDQLTIPDIIDEEENDGT